MTITSKPNDNDSIIKKSSDSVGNDIFVATLALSTFFNDLLAEFSSNNDLEKNIALLSSAQSNAKKIQNDAELLRLSIEQKLAQFNSITSKILEAQLELEKRIKNMEQTQWR